MGKNCSKRLVGSFPSGGARRWDIVPLRGVAAYGSLSVSSSTCFEEKNIRSTLVFKSLHLLLPKTQYTRLKTQDYFSMLSVGQTHQLTFSFTQADVEAFARVTGDTNPIHLDAGYAAQTVFRRPIIHGMLGASVFSRVLGTEFPGAGSIYLSQTLAFQQPMYVDTAYEAVFTVQEILPRSSARIETKIMEKESGKVVTTGEAMVMNRQLIPNTKRS